MWKTMCFCSGQLQSSNFLCREADLHLFPAPLLLMLCLGAQEEVSEVLT